MQLFGGDPRIVFLKIVLEINKIYVGILITIFLCLLLLRTSDETFVFTFIVFAIVELFRLGLSMGYTRGSVPLFFVFMILTAIPLLVLDFLWIFYVETRTGFDYVVMSGMTILHIVELFVLSIIQCIQFSKYQSSFFRFQYGYRNVDTKINNDEDDGVVANAM